MADSKLWLKAYEARYKKIDRMQRLDERRKNRPKKYTHYVVNSPYVPPKLKVETEQKISNRVSIIDIQILELKAERKLLIQRLKPWVVEYEKRNFTLYVLKLVDGCWYIGITRNLEKRWRQHQNCKGAKWTKAHPPMEVFETMELKTNLESEASQMEDEITLMYAELYGIEYVRGGGYCQSEPVWPVHLLIHV